MELATEAPSSTLSSHCIFLINTKFYKIPKVVAKLCKQCNTLMVGSLKYGCLTATAVVVNFTKYGALSGIIC